MKLSPIKTFIYYFLQATWGIIQNVIGLLLWLILLIINPKRRIQMFYGDIVSEWKIKRSLSLGIFIFLGRNDQRIVVHEYGHSIQSMILGPFYLILIGIPSLIWSMCFNKYRTKNRKNYYLFYTERWANKLAVNFTGLNTMEA